MRTRKIEKFIDDSGRTWNNVVFFGVKGVTMTDAVTVPDPDDPTKTVTFPRTVFSGEEQKAYDIVDSDGLDVATADGNEIIVPYYDVPDVSQKTNGRNHPSSYASGVDGVRQSLYQRMSLIQGELWYDKGKGFPLLQKQMGKNVFDAYILDVTLNHPDVTRLATFKSEVNGHMYIAKISFETAYGETTFAASQTI